MSEIIWEDPPRNPRGISKFAAVAEALRLRPGEWALIASGLGDGQARSLGANINAGRMKCFEPRGAFRAQCVSRQGMTGAKVYAKYVGE